MNGAVWVFSAVLALVFLITGVMKVFRFEQAKERLLWVNDVPRGLVTLIGIAEILGALGLILPVATGICAWLTPVAAAALALLMLMASVFHALRHDKQETGLPVLLLLFAALVAYFRWMAAPPI